MNNINRFFALIGFLYSFYCFSLFFLDFIESVKLTTDYESQVEMAWCFFGGFFCLAVLISKNTKLMPVLMCIMYFYLSLNLAVVWLL